MKRFAWVSLSLAALSSGAHAVVWADDITNTTVRNFAVNDSRFSGVGEVDFGGFFGTGTYLGTGNGTSYILTANHVLGMGKTGTFTLGAQTLSVTGAYLYGADVMVAKVNTAIPATVLASLFQPALNTLPITATAGLNVVSAGVGGYRAQSSNNTRYDYVKRAFQTVSGATTQRSDMGGTGTGYYVADRFDAPGDADKRAIEGFGAGGDSGSMYMSESTNQILGVLSYGPTEKYGAVNYYSAILPEYTADIYLKTGIQAVPEPASLVALGLGVAAFARRRRRA